MDSVVQIVHEIDPAIFPQIDSNEWSQDNMGPIYVPKKGVTITINDENLPPTTNKSLNFMRTIIW